MTALTVAGMVLGAFVYDTARLIGSSESRCPPLARVLGRRPALEAAERRLVGLRLRGRIDEATYRRRMTAIAHGLRDSDPPRRPLRRRT
ncbi:hypothetical protein [Streptomyces sp. NPDC002825]|uniref:hypothetical protein n=1 Tax=Streptomyces sp. NPDC002825 TaxID=3154666 RepID=UPI00332AA76C